MTSQNKVLLQVDSLQSYYGKAQILFDMSLELNPGEVVVLLGRNGAGKSTTFKSIMGLVTPKKGKVIFNGREVQGLPPYKICTAGLGYVPEERRIFANLTTMENLEVGKQPARSGSDPWTPERLFELFPNLGEMKNRPGGQMSGGEQQMLTIARTLMGNPELIILDEPSEGLAPVIVDQLAYAIQKLKEQGVSILLAEQNLHFAKFVSDRAYIMDHGSVCYEGRIDELTDDIYDQYLAV